MSVALRDSDVGAFRRHFPLLGRWVYLATCSLGARSNKLDASLSRMLEEIDDHGAPWAQFEEQVAEARNRFAALIGAQPGQVAVVPNASVGAYQVASTLHWERRRKILTTAAEFPSVAHVWLAQRPRGAQVVYATERAGTVPAEEYLGALDADTRLVSIPLVTYCTGARLDAEEVIAAARTAGARTFVDAYQAVGVEPIDVDDLGCDYLVAGSMKYLLGLPGVAFLYARDGGVGDCSPQLTGWFGRVDPFSFNPHLLDFPDEARRFETGTPSTPSLYATNAGLALIGGLDLQAVRRHVASLVGSAAARLAGAGEVLSLDGAPASARRGAHVGLLDDDPPALAAWLAERHIVVSPRGRFIRLAFHFYNNDADVTAVCDELARYRRQHRRLVLTRLSTDTPLHPAAQAVCHWLQKPDPAAFPYGEVVGEYRSGGKHFVGAPLLHALRQARASLAISSPPDGGPTTPERELAWFLDTALDKADGRYHYPTYLGLGLLGLPGIDRPRRDTGCEERLCDRLFVHLVCDALAFELDAAEGTQPLLPQMRPDTRTVHKRCRHGLRAITPAITRLGLLGLASNLPATVSGVESADPVGDARRLCRKVDGELSPDERRRLLLSMLPVYVSHDEYLFIRVLQSFETAFAQIAVLLCSAALALGDGDSATASERLTRAEAVQSEAAPLFSLLATMQVEAFRAFRTFTEGASAIQSRNYKTVESLCRLPDADRVNSVAYLSVPEVRDRVLAGQATLDDAFEAATASAHLNPAESFDLAEAMRRFATVLLAWRQTHYRLAVRMLGERPGTGYTEGTPYLKSVRTIPVFSSVEVRP